MKYILKITPCLLLAACASSYHPWDGTTGYRETRLSPGTWEITYTEGSSPDTQVAKYHAALRCSDIAEAAGANEYKFTVLKEESVTKTAAVGSSYISGLNGAMSVSEEGGRDQKHTSNIYQKTYRLPVITGTCEIMPADQTSPQPPHQ